MTTARLNLPEMTAQQAGKHLTYNEAATLLDIFAASNINSISVSTPPTDPANGDTYLVPTGATGDWASHIGRLAYWFNSEWNFADLPTGWVFEVRDEERVVVARTSGLEDVGGTGATIQAVTVTDYDQLDQLNFGFYSAFHSDISSVLNAPAFKSSTNVSVLIKVFPEGDRVVVEAVETKRTDSTHQRVKVDASTWGAWRDLWAEIAAAAASGGGSGGSLTASEVKTLYESNADTNAFTDSEENKLAGIQSGAQVNPDASGVKTLYESNADTNAFTDAEKTKLSGLQNVSVTGKAYADITSGNVTLNAEQSNVPVIQLGGTPGTNRTLTLAALERMWVITNDSDGGCTLTTGSGGTVFLEAGFQYVVFGDGVGVRAAVTIAPNGLKMNGDLILPIFSVASLPDPATRYMVTVGCTDGDSGSPCLAVSDGGSWKRISLGATVSAT